MAATTLINSVLLKQGETTSEVEVATTGLQALNLSIAATKVSTGDSQVRLLVFDQQGRTLATRMVENSDSESVQIIDGLDGEPVSIGVECLLGSARVTVQQHTDLQTNPFDTPAIDSAAIADGAITTPKLGAGAVTAPKLGAAAVGTAALAALAVTKAKTNCFFSTEQTGTGAPQNVPHGLGAVPAGVLIGVTEDPAGTGFDVAEGAHDGTNVVVTVTTGVKFKVFAMA